MGNRQPRPPPFRPQNVFRDCDRELNNLRNSYNGQINDLKNQISNKQKDVDSLYKKVRDISKDLKESQESDKEHIRQLNDWRMKYNDSQKKVADLKKEIKSLETQIEDLLKRMNNLKTSAEVSATTTNALSNSLEQMTNINKDTIIEGATAMDTILNTQKINNSFYDAVIAQNDTIDNKIQDVNSKYTTDDKKTVYQLQKNTLLMKVNFSLLLVYYGLVIVFMYVFYKKYINLSKYVIALVFVLVCAYPWVISMIEAFLYLIGRYFIAIIHGNISTQGNNPSVSFNSPDIYSENP